MNDYAATQGLSRSLGAGHQHGLQSGRETLVERHWAEHDPSEFMLLGNQRTPAEEWMPYTGPKTDMQIAALKVLAEIGEVEQGPRKRRFFSSSSLWMLVAVLALQSLLSLRLVWSNTAYSDEALYLWAGHLELSHWLRGTPVPSYQTYFSGAPVIYPPIGAIADAIGGLAGARLLSLAFMLGATSLLYGTGTRVAGRTVGICSALVFALLGPVQFLSAFATYDALSLFLLALASWLVIRGSGPSGPLSELYLIGGGLTLALADATKYAATLWDPVVIVLALLSATEGGKLRRSLHGVRVLFYTATTVCVALFRFGGRSYVQGILFTTIARQVGSGTASAGLVLGDSFNWLWFLLILALIGTGLSFAGGDKIQAFAGKGRFRAVLITCTLAALLAPLHQAQIHTNVSLHKHVAFGAWFAAIAAGYALARAMGAAHEKGWRIAAAAAIVMSFAGMQQATQLYTDGWPNMGPTEAVLARSIAGSGCPCLVTADTITYYYYSLKNVYPGDLGEFTGPYFFYYWDAAEHRELNGTAAYLQAIHDHYFVNIEIDPGEPFASAAAVQKAIAETPGYQQIAAINVTALEYNEVRGVVRIWHYNPKLAERARA